MRSREPRRQGQGGRELEEPPGAVPRPRVARSAGRPQHPPSTGVAVAAGGRVPSAQDATRCSHYVCQRARLPIHPVCKPSHGSPPPDPSYFPRVRGRAVTGRRMTGKLCSRFTGRHVLSLVRRLVLSARKPRAPGACKPHVRSPESGGKTPPKSEPLGPK